MLLIGTMVRGPLLLLMPESQSLVVYLAIFASLAGHAGLATWNAATLGSLVREPARAAYRDATRMLVAALAFAVASLVLRGPGSFVVVALPTAIVAVVLLRRHERRALAVLEEASAGSTG